MRKSVSLIIENRSCGSLWQTPDRPIMLMTLTTGGAAGTKLVRPHFSSSELSRPIGSVFDDADGEFGDHDSGEASKWFDIE